MTLDGAGPSSQALAVDPGWRSFVGIHGGYLLGHILHAAHMQAGAAPVAFSATFLRSVPPGPIHVAAGILRRGRSVVNVGVDVLSGDLDFAVSGRITATTESARAKIGTPDPVPPKSSDPSGRPFLPAELVPFSTHVEYRPTEDSNLFRPGTPRRLRCWVRVLADVSPLLALGVALDSLPPSSFAATDSPSPMPTLEISGHILSPVPAAGAWLFVDQWVCDETDRVVIDEVVISSEAGHRIARARQSRLTRPTGA